MPIRCKLTLSWKHTKVSISRVTSLAGKSSTKAGLPYTSPFVIAPRAKSYPQRPDGKRCGCAGR
jgi:hypothetical protein